MSQRGRSRSILSGPAVLAACVVLAAVTAFAAGHRERAQREVPGKVGTKAPAFTATLLTGETLDSRSLLGKVVVLKFWYVACGPCRQEIPQLNQMVDEFKDQPVVFLGLALDGPEKIRAFLEEMPYRSGIRGGGTRSPDGDRVRPGGRSRGDRGDAVHVI